MTLCNGIKNQTRTFYYKIKVIDLKVYFPRICRCTANVGGKDLDVVFGGSKEIA
jgi:hypothetical protein